MARVAVPVPIRTVAEILGVPERASDLKRWSDVLSTCVHGEIYLVTETDEVLMQPGDTVIIRGVNHAWSNRSSAPCLLVGTNTDATPLVQH